ncbi:hypothetical protein CPLU01_06589 [Colletotrichum plurivorum]|uniref:Uncharacterized protein n=1 Tax=Colletotrichum plurivorum TaxID=2175906 RepID=A0A8H6KHL9_9PEZI|nr:hypothetical protein CPLU01_06589 [Colletotrichum plurivorum]
MLDAQSIAGAADETAPPPPSSSSSRESPAGPRDADGARRIATFRCKTAGAGARSARSARRPPGSCG